jgi:diacylglycerol kinase
MKLFKSFAYAWHGIRHSYKTQLNFRIHLLVLSGVVVAGLVLQINPVEWLFITVCSMLVLSLELMNTAIEYLCDTVTTEIHPIIKIVKDASAAAVLLAAAGSVVTGFIIFLPKIFTFVKSYA